jgi:antigen flippase
MKSALLATLVLSSTSAVSMLVGLVSAKVYAVVLGPSGFGQIALLQSLVGLGGLVAGMGVGTGLVRMGANAIDRDDYGDLAALQRAAWLLFWLLGSLAFLLLITFREPLSRWILGGIEHAQTVALMGVAMLFSVASGIQSSILNAYHRVAALAKVGIVNSILGTALSLVLVSLYREKGIPAAVIAGTIVSWIVSRYFLGKAVPGLSITMNRQNTIKAAHSLLHFGFPYTLSMLVGTGIYLALPAVVLNILGPESVGLYQAAVKISVVYFGLVLSGLAQDYYPRVAAASARPTDLIDLMNEQHKVVMVLGLPLIFGMMALAPYLVPVLYSEKFSPTIDILQWQLIGDLFKFSSWVLSFVILARCSPQIYFLTELTWGTSFLITSMLGMHWLGLQGLGISYLVSYLIYYLTVWAIVRKDVGLVWNRENKRIMIAALIAVAVITVLSSLGMETLRTPVALTFAAIAAGMSLFFFIKEMVRAKSVVP